MLRSGGFFNLLDPWGVDIAIEDIAHALSNICRFTGHSRFYSVAQHSVLVSRLVPTEHAFAGLMHDAHEALVGDVSTPLKRLLPQYRAIEDRIQEAVLSSFDVEMPLHPCVKDADMVALATEKRDVFAGAGDVEWPLLNGIAPDVENIRPMHPGEAYLLFLNRYNETRN